MKDSFILYNSFYEPIKELKDEQLGKLLRAIFNYTINGEVTKDKEILIAFMFIKNQIDLDTNKWQEEKQKRAEAGRLGGIKRALNKNQALSSKSKQCLDMLSNAKQTQANQGDNVNVNVNENVNVNDNDNVINNISSSSNNNYNIYEYFEKSFGRLITPVEYEKIENWKKDYEEEIIKEAIKISVLNNKKTFNYVNGILNNWKSKGYKTIEEIKEEKINKEETKEVFEYDWLNEEE